MSMNEFIIYLSERTNVEIMEPPSTMFNLHNPAWVDGYREAMNQATIEACHQKDKYEPEFNKNQQIVFEYGKNTDIDDFLEEITCQHYRTPESVLKAMNELDHREKLLVIRATIDTNLKLIH